MAVPNTCFVQAQKVHREYEEYIDRLKQQIDALRKQNSDGMLEQLKEAQGMQLSAAKATILDLKQQLQHCTAKLEKNQEELVAKDCLRIGLQVC